MQSQVQARLQKWMDLAPLVCELREDLPNTFAGSYSTFLGSPASYGQLQYDLWDKTELVENAIGRYDWIGLKQKVRQYGLRNSTLLAPMPTASTSQILGFNECFEPMTTNLYTRRTLAGEFVVVNKYLMDDLLSLRMWNEALKNRIVASKGSIQGLEDIPAEIRTKYKTVWEIPMKDVILMAADRGIFICQSQSMNLWQAEPTYSSLTSMHFFAFAKGLKTGMYYLRRQGAHHAQQFTVAPTQQQQVQTADGSVNSVVVGSIEPVHCDVCSA
jgi:ribonucleotide reductase alpha subunit